MGRQLADRQVDVVDLLTKLGVRNVTDGGDEIIFSCPFPTGHMHGDEKPSAYMNARTTAWMCHGCKKRGNAVTFVAELENVSPLRASRWLTEAYGPGTREPEGGSMAREWESFFAPQEQASESVNPPITESTTKRFYVNWDKVANALQGVTRNEDGSVPPELAYLFQRGLLVPTLVDNEFGYDPISNRITFAVRNEVGELVGFKGRSTWADADVRYLVLGDRERHSVKRYGFAPYKTGQVVYLLHNASVTGRLVVCEGELNAVFLRQYGVHEAVGIAGSMLSKRQADLIVRHADEAVLIFDELEDAIAASRQLESRVRVRIARPHDTDPADAGKDASLRMIKDATSSVELLLPS